MTSSRTTTESPGADVEIEAPRKKGARGGKRSVTHLSKAQLARKRANDREAQRNIRQRTKEHIENLEKKVKDLEAGRRSSSVERILKRNQELEIEVERLRVHLAQQNGSPTLAPELRSELSIPQKDPLQWVPEPANSCPWPQSGLPSHIPQLDRHESANSSDLARYQVEDQTYPASAGSYDSEEHQQFGTAIPVWDDQKIFGQESVVQPLTDWTPFHPSLSQPSRFAELPPTQISEVINNPTYTTTTCWQSQPSIYAWQISTKLKAPVTHVDQLMFSVIHSQRHLHLTSDLSGSDITGPEFPSVHMLFNNAPDPIKAPSTLTEVMARYSAVLSNRGFALIPEKLASFMCMYRFVQWQISPTFTTYQALHSWQAPCEAQLVVAHPAWMDLPPWPKFREKVILEQDRYSNSEFQNDYARNLSVNFPYDPMKALVFDEGQIRVSHSMEVHLSDLSNMSMKLPFAQKYPEFRDVCRFDEV